MLSSLRIHQEYVCPCHLLPNIIIHTREKSFEDPCLDNYNIQFISKSVKVRGADGCLRGCLPYSGAVCQADGGPEYPPRPPTHVHPSRYGSN